jgi:hypothetical protein
MELIIKNLPPPGLTTGHENQPRRIRSATTPVVVDVTVAKSGDFALQETLHSAR